MPRQTRELITVEINPDQNPDVQLIAAIDEVLTTFPHVDKSEKLRVLYYFAGRYEHLLKTPAS